MILEIKGTGSHNKGAEMMLLTILQELRNQNLKFSVPATNDCSYDCYSKYNLYPKLWLKIKGFQIGHLGKIIPKKLRDIFGVIIDEEIDVVLDASGFAYSSQWGLGPTQEMAKNVLNWKKQGKKIILLPQAFGPFESSEIKNNIKKIIENTDLIFARDENSYNHLINIKKQNTIKLYPDFTNLFKGELPDYWNEDLEICIVPNVRMKDKRSDAQNYEKLFSEAIKYFQDNNLKPFFLIHGGDDDKELSNKINSNLQVPIPILNEENPHYIKGIIANSKGLFGSRFHSLASALSSNVIAIGTGWSHKYKYLFMEYDFEEGLIDVNEDFDEIKNKIDLIIFQDISIKNKIKNKNVLLREKSDEMFGLIRQEIGL